MAKGKGAGSAIIQVVIVAALVAGGVFVYARRQTDIKQTMEAAKAAKEKTEGDDAPALLAAKKQLDEIGAEKIEKNDAILATYAEIEAQLFQAYGVQDAKPIAQKYVG